MSKEAMKLALEALDDRSSLMKWQAARESLRQAIAEAEKQEQGEPVAVVDANDDGYWADILPDRSVKVGQLLYTTPYIPEGRQQRKPLTDEQIDKAMAENKQTLIDAADNYWKMRRAYARIIEAAHGIKE